MKPVAPRIDFFRASTQCKRCLPPILPLGLLLLSLAFVGKVGAVGTLVGLDVLELAVASLTA